MTDAADPFLSFKTVFPRQLPAVAARVINLHRQLRAFEHFAPARQDALIAAQLTHLLRHAKRQSPFWAERLSAWAPGGKTPADVLRDVPLLTRHDIQAHGHRLAADFPERARLGILTNTSSGSTGTPVSVELSRGLYAPLYHAVTLMGSAWHGFDPRKPLGVIGTKQKDKDRAPLGPPYSWFGPVAAGFQFCSRDRDVSVIFDHCAQKKPVFLQSGPQTLRRLAEYALEHGRDDLRIEKAFTLGSAVTDEIRDVVRRGLGAEIADRYSSEENGYIALQCPNHHTYHVISPVSFVEIVDKNGAPCPPGTPGRVLVTSTQSYAMPLIRYDIGDMAEWGPPCDCGIGLPVIAKLWGRIRQMVVTPDGREVFGNIYARDFADIAGLKEYRFVLHQNAVVVAQLTVTQPSAHLASQVTERLQKALTYPYPVHIRYVDRIDWGSSWKQENFAVSDVPPGAENAPS